MGDASEAILGAGRRIRADAKIRRWPEAYREKRGLKLFNILVNELARIEGAGAIEALEAFEAL